MMMMMFILYLLETKGETENVGVCTKERKGVAAEVLMATPCTKSLVLTSHSRANGSLHIP